MWVCNLSCPVSTCAWLCSLDRIKSIFFAVTPACYPGELSFNTSVNTSSNSVRYYTGTPTVCVNGTKLPICNGTSLDYNVVTRVCLFSTGFSLISKLKWRVRLCCKHFTDIQLYKYIYDLFFIVILFKKPGGPIH